MKHKILLVDDESSILDALYRALSELDARITKAADGIQALEAIKKQAPDIVVTDLKMPRMGGLSLMEEVNKINPSIQVIVITGHGTIEDAVNAMKQGAYDFITKPFKKQQIVTVVKRAMEKVSLLQENINLKQKLKKTQGNDFDWVKSREFKELIERSTQAAKSDATILIFGEAGTGKGVLASHIFENSARSEQPIVKINCAAIPDTALEAELFGYKKDAFIGAVQDRKGKFHEAHKGTIFLEEIGEITPAVQAKLLRVLQSGEITSIGGRAEKVDVRIIAATSRNLRKLVEKGKFREDLFYRLNVIPLTISPLRDRPEDLTSLFSFFLQKYCKKNKRENLTVSADALGLIEYYKWPGNVRELENAVELAVILCRGHQITPEDLPPELSNASGTSMILNYGKGMTLSQIEKHVIETSLKRFNGDKARMAEALGISMRTVYRKLDGYAK